MNSIQIPTWGKANKIYKELFNCFSVQPVRIRNSVEDGVALVYGKRSGIFNKVYKEFFIEIYNDLTVSYVATKNYQQCFTPVEQIPRENFDTFLSNLKRSFKTHFV